MEFLERKSRTTLGTRQQKTFSGLEALARSTVTIEDRCPGNCGKDVVRNKLLRQAEENVDVCADIAINPSGFKKSYTLTIYRTPPPPPVILYL